MSIESPDITVFESTSIEASRHANGVPPRSVFMMDPTSQPLIYSREDEARLASITKLNVGVVGREAWRDRAYELKDTEIIFSGWGAPLMDDEFLAAFPKLRAVFYAAGSVRYFVTEDFWKRGIVLSSAFAANAVPVAEYTLATTLLSLKHFWGRAEQARRGEGWGDHTRAIPGSFRANVGLVSFGMIARRVAVLLKQFDIRVMAYCPYLSDMEARDLGVEKMSLAELFAKADVVSVHTPLLPETRGLVTGRLVASMKAGATLINTARGGVLAQREIESVLRARPDLHAVLDVTDPEPPQADDPLFGLSNVTVTSHIAGSHGRDCHRLGNYMVDEFRRYLVGEPLRWQITREKAARMA